LLSVFLGKREFLEPINVCYRIFLLTFCIYVLECIYSRSFCRLYVFGCYLISILLKYRFTFALV
jgi:hypothetical protein